MIEQPKSIREVLQKEEIKVSDLVTLLWEKKRVFYGVLLVTVFLGMVKFFSTPKFYESTAIMLSEVQDERAQMGQLGAFAGLAGINLSSASGNQMFNTLPPELYPKLIESKPFLLDLIYKEFYFSSKGKSMTVKDYYLEERPNDILSKFWDAMIGLPYVVISWFQSEPGQDTTVNQKDGESAENPYLVLTSDENYVIEELKKNIKIENKDRMISLSVKMPEPLIAAEFNRLVFEKILEFVRDYKTEKKKTNLEFIQERANEAEQNFKSAQIRLASFRDANQGIISQKARTREEQLEAEFNLSFQLFSTLKQELENSKIELKKETPIFTPFEKAIVPNAPSNPSPLKIFIICVFIGSLLGLIISVILLGRDYLRAA